MDKNQNVSLGCGTLILIALIVMIFGGDQNNNLSREVLVIQNELLSQTQEIRALKSEVASQTDEIKALKAMIAERLPLISEISM